MRLRRTAGAAALAALALFAPARADDPGAMPAEAHAELSTAIDLLKTHHMYRNTVDWAAIEFDA